MRVRSIVFWLFAGLVVAGGLAWYWLLHTEPGARWVLARVGSATDGGLQLGPVDGNLADGLSIGAVSFTTDGFSTSAGEILLAVDVDLLPVSVEVVRAELHDVDVEISEAERTPEGPADIENALRRLSLPVPIRITDLDATDIAIRVPGFERELDRIELVALWHETITVDRLFVDGEALSVTLDGTFDPATDLAHVGNVSVRLDPAITGHHESIDVELRSEGTHRELTLHVDVTNFDATLQGEVRHVFHAPAWDLEISVPHYAWPLEDNAGTVDLVDLFLRSRGTPDDYSIGLESTITVPTLGPSAVRVEGRGNLDGFSAAIVDVSGADLQLSGRSGVRWSGERFVEGEFEIVRFDPEKWVAGWPGGYPLAGDVAARLDDTGLRLRDSRLTVPRSGAMVQVDADIDLETDNVSGALQWHDLRWPLSGDTYTIKSDLGDVTVSGTLDDWRVQGRIAVGTEDMPEGSFDVDGRGDRDGAAVRIIDGSMLGGTVLGSLGYSWRDEQAWRGEIDVVSLATEPLLPDWPGRISGHVRANGSLRPRLWDITLEGISGEVRGNPLSLSGRVMLEEDSFAARGLSIRHGDSSLELDGSPDTPAGLDFDVQIAATSQYLGDMTGSLSAYGKVRLSQDDPYLSLNLESDALAYRDVRATGIRIEDARAPGEIAGIRVSATELEISRRKFDEVMLKLAFADNGQSLEVAAGYLEGSVSLMLDGALDDWRAPLDSAWRGRVLALSVAIDEAHAVSLVEPAPAVLSGRAVEIEALCLGSGISRLCADGDWEDDGRFGVTLELDEVPVALVELLADSGLRFDQAVDGRLSWRHEPVTGPSGRGELRISPGRIESTEDPAIGLRTGEGSLSFEIVDNRLLSGAISLPMPGTGDIHGSFILEDIGDPTDSAIRGDFDANVSEIAILSELVPFLDAASGRLHAQARVSGTLAAPLLTGELKVDGGSFEYLPMGLLLEDLSLDARMGRNYQVDIDGRFRTGDGNGEVRARVDYRDIEQPSIDIGLSGENLLLVDVPDVRVAVNPELHIVATPEALAINGAVFVPEARIKPVNLTTTRAYESEDVVIVAGELPDPPVESKGDGVRYSGTLDVTLGDNVVIDLDLARATVTGSTKFAWRGDAMPMANGRYDVAGTISAFGQVLDITEGSVRFPDVPADSPYLRIRAEREIYGNTQVKRAGVLVDGPLKRPTMEAYTQPLTTEERALTLLVTGSDFDYEQGVGAIDFGTYIAPRLFVSYGVGVFERENIISARFDLAKGFGIKASSGSKESGVDLNYRFEN